MISRHPESDVSTFLEACAASLGLVLDRDAKTRALLELRSIRLADGDVDEKNILSAIGGDNNTAMWPPRSPDGINHNSIANNEGKAGDQTATRSPRSAGDMKGRDVKTSGRSGGGDQAITCAEDVYAAVATALSKALVHCQRFEVQHALTINNSSDR